MKYIKLCKAGSSIFGIVLIASIRTLLSSTSNVVFASIVALVSSLCTVPNQSICKQVFSNADMRCTAWFDGTHEWGHHDSLMEEHEP